MRTFLSTARALAFAPGRSLLVASLLLSPLSLLRAADAAAPVRDEVLVIVGAQGEDVFGEGFAAAAKNWQAAADRAKVTCTIIGLDPKKDAEAAPTDKDRVREWLAKLDPNSSANAWIAYIGHGTFDGREARMNLRGPDILPAELAEWLKPVRRPVVFVGGSSAGAPFLNALSGPNRIILAATRSGNELNYARFGERFAEAMAGEDTDIDQDGQASLLEAFVTAAQRVQGFYRDADRMLTEHALLDDNGDKNGTPADFFKGTRVVKTPQAPRGGGPAPAVDGARARLLSLTPNEAERALTAEQLAKRADLERRLELLRGQKNRMGEDAYYAALEPILRELAALYASPASLAPPSAAASPAVGR
jgi:hypothetical protein